MFCNMGSSSTGSGGRESSNEVKVKVDLIEHAPGSCVKFNLLASSLLKTR